MQRRSSRGQKGAGRKAKGMRAGAGGKRRGTCKRTVTNRLKAAYSSSKNGVAERASRGRGTVCRGRNHSSTHMHADTSLSPRICRGLRHVSLGGQEKRLKLHAGSTRFTRKARERERWEGGGAAEGASVSVRAGASVMRRTRMHNSPERRRRSIMLPASPRD